ncbi:hypothetical protein NPIL_578131 [Nephila pilipes]|uniref:Uncharacterized protein n=1 Tax=Nephila pilipes TaxID=299642 RepID=A0A8X6TV99_NEPPI|nr:hypothetical protein NPIL_578131 [Nephila pilipes]
MEGSSAEKRQLFQSRCIRYENSRESLFGKQIDSLEDFPISHVNMAAPPLCSRSANLFCVGRILPDCPLPEPPFNLLVQGIKTRVREHGKQTVGSFRTPGNGKKQLKTDSREPQGCGGRLFRNSPIQNPFVSVVRFFEWPW